MKKPVEVSFSYPLTVPTEGKTLAVDHFPTAYQTLIFRLWEMVDYRKIAKVLKRMCFALPRPWAWVSRMFWTHG